MKRFLKIIFILFVLLTAISYAFEIYRTYPPEISGLMIGENGLTSKKDREILQRQGFKYVWITNGNKVLKRSTEKRDSETIGPHFYTRFMAEDGEYVDIRLKNKMDEMSDSCINYTNECYNFLVYKYSQDSVLKEHLGDTLYPRKILQRF